MADEEKKVTEAQKEEPEVIAETYYDDEDAAASEPWEDEVKVSDKVFNCVVGSVPVDVLEHLNNGRKEFIKAGIAMAESRLSKADDFMDKAKKAHEGK